MRRSSCFQLPEGFQKLGMEVLLHLFVPVRNMATVNFNSIASEIAERTEDEVETKDLPQCIFRVASRS